MTEMIYNPQEEFEQKFAQLHLDNTKQFFENLVKLSGVDIQANKDTVTQYHFYKENVRKLRTKRNWLRFWRVLMCITLVLIPVVILKTTPAIRALLKEIEEADKKAEELLQKAYAQMQPLNNLFTDRDALELIEKTIPLVNFDTCFTAKQEADMKENYDYIPQDSEERSTLDVLSGTYNGNPFVFENKFIKSMGMETYHGYKTISWTETYYSDGKLRTRTRTQTLHATVTKPKPFYSTQVVLSYGAQGAPELSFTRDPGNLDEKSEGAVKRHVKRGEKKLKRMTDKAIANNDDFMSMSNTEFEVLFDALDRTHEVQFRTLFTPLAQTNMVDLILSKIGFGDDFHFLKRNRMNTIVSDHSQGRQINLLPEAYKSYDFEIIKAQFESKNTEFFKAVYFDFAPLWAIPAYQEHPVHSLKPIPDLSRLYSFKECEALANTMDRSYVVHPDTKTPAILKTEYMGSRGDEEQTRITAYSFDMLPRIDYVPVWGGDGNLHNVAVHWDEYIALEAINDFCIAAVASAAGKSIISARNDLCIYQR